MRTYEYLEWWFLLGIPNLYTYLINYFFLYGINCKCLLQYCLLSSWMVLFIFQYKTQIFGPIQNYSRIVCLQPQSRLIQYVFPPVLHIILQTTETTHNTILWIPLRSLSRRILQILFEFNDALSFSMHPIFNGFHANIGVGESFNYEDILTLKLQKGCSV